MSAVTGKELDILVEDEVARSLLQSSLPASLRSRVTISVIGSATALARQLAALYVRGEERPTLATRVRQFASENTYFSLRHPSVYAGFRPHFWKCV